jgi:hypothetical protein
MSLKLTYPVGTPDTRSKLFAYPMFVTRGGLNRPNGL